MPPGSDFCAPTLFWKGSKENRAAAAPRGPTLLSQGLLRRER